MLNPTLYPLIFDLVYAHTTYSTKIALRLVSHSLLERVDADILRHVKISAVQRNPQFPSAPCAIQLLTPEGHKLPFPPFNAGGHAWRHRASMIKIWTWDRDQLPVDAFLEVTPAFKLVVMQRIFALMGKEHIKYSNMTLIDRVHLPTTHTELPSKSFHHKLELEKRVINVYYDLADPNVHRHVPIPTAPKAFHLVIILHPKPSAGAPVQTELKKSFLAHFVLLSAVERVTVVGADRLVREGGKEIGLEGTGPELKIAKHAIRELRKELKPGRQRTVVARCFTHNQYRNRVGQHAYDIETCADME